jgi:hypothetical protein
MGEGRVFRTIFGITLIALLAAVVYVVVEHRAAAASTLYSDHCVAAKDEICAEQWWYDDWRRWKALQAEIRTEGQSAQIRALQDKIDLQNGIQNRLNAATQQLNAATQQSYAWDEQKQRFVKKQDVPPLVAAPAPPPKK